MSLYNAAGQRQVTIVAGNAITGLYAADGSYNGVLSSGTAPVGLQHPCGAYNVTPAVGQTAAQAPDGSLYVSPIQGSSFYGLPGGTPATLTPVVLPGGAFYQNAALTGFTVPADAGFTLNSALSPAFTQTGAIFREGTVNRFNTANSNALLPALSASTAYTVSIYVKRIVTVLNPRNTQLTVNNGLGTAQAAFGATLDGAGIPTQFSFGPDFGPNGAPSVTLGTGGWYKMSCVINTINAIAAPNIDLFIFDPANGEPRTGDGKSSLAFWGLDIR